MPTIEKNSKSKLKLIEATISLLSSKGFTNSGINEILETAKVTKSNFYYHFKSKEELCLAALDELTKCFVEQILNQTFLNPALSPKARLENFFYLNIKMLEENCCRQGCPFVNLASETSDFYPSFREKIDHFFSLYKNAIKTCYEEGVQQAEFRKDLDSEQIAQFILSSINGSMVLVKALKTTQVIEQNAAMLLQLIKNPSS